MKMIQKIIAWLRHKWRMYKARPAKLRRAIRRAKQLHRKDGRRYRVFFLENRYQVLTRTDIQSKKHEKFFANYINSTKMQPLAFFDTATMEPSPFANQLLTRKVND